MGRSIRSNASSGWQRSLLAALIRGHAARCRVRLGLPDITVAVIDAKTLLHGAEHEHTRLDLGGFGLPIETIRRWACLGNVTPIVGFDAPGSLLGRTARLGQPLSSRRALRAWYRTCACCDVVFEHCQIPPRQLVGTRRPHQHRRPCPCATATITSLTKARLATLSLLPDRSLRIVLPNGEIRVHSPPTVIAA